MSILIHLQIKIGILAITTLLFSSWMYTSRCVSSYNLGIESLEQNQISLEPDVVNLWYLKLRLIDLTWIHSLKYLKYATFGSKDIVIKKSEFVAKTQFL